MNRLIPEFAGEFRWLSNFWPCRVVWGDHVTPTRTWSCVEVPYQLAKTLDRGLRATLINQVDNDPLPFDPDELLAREAKRWGKKLKPSQIRPDWEDVRVCIMHNLLRSKFAENPDLAMKLLETGQAHIQEGNRWGDLFWGVSLVALQRDGRDVPVGSGINQLGRLLMQVRRELQDAVKAVA